MFELRYNLLLNTWQRACLSFMKVISVVHLKEANSIHRVILYYYDQFHGGSISEGSELQIEVAEFLWRNVQVFTPKINYIFFFYCR